MGAAAPGREPERDRVRGAAEFAALSCDQGVVTSAASSTNFPAAPPPRLAPRPTPAGAPSPPVPTRDETLPNHAYPPHRAAEAERPIAQQTATNTQTGPAQFEPD